MLHSSGRLDASTANIEKFLKETNTLAYFLRYNTEK